MRSTPDTTTINGKGRSTSGGDIAVIRAQPGKRHRFRLVSTSCFPSWVLASLIEDVAKFILSYTFSIDGHNLTVIEADGVETEPVTVDSLTIFAGASQFCVLINTSHKLTACTSPAILFRCEY